MEFIRFLILLLFIPFRFFMDPLEGSMMRIGQVLMLAGFGSAFWVLIDSSNLRKGISEGERTPLGSMRPVAWFIGCVLLWIVFFPWYISRRVRFMKWQRAKPRQCTSCMKYYEGQPSFCPNCGAEIKPLGPA
jgi:hypothetical protein